MSIRGSYLRRRLISGDMPRLSRASYARDSIWLNRACNIPGTLPLIRSSTGQAKVVGLKASLPVSFVFLFDYVIHSVYLVAILARSTSCAIWPFSVSWRQPVPYVPEVLPMWERACPTLGG